MDFVKHSAPGIFSVRFFVFFFSDGTQKAASHQEMRAETGLREGFHSETPRRPLGAETRGARVEGSA